MIPFKLFLDRSLRFVPTPLDVPLYLFYAAAIISVFRAIMFFGADFYVVVMRSRLIVYYLIIFVITNLLREKRQIKFVINGLFVVANIVGLAIIIQAIVGRSIQLLPGTLRAAGVFASRIIPPGTTLVYIIFITAVCSIVFINRPILKSIHFYTLPIIGTGILLTYWRSYWIALVFSLSILMILISKRSKKRFIAYLLISVILMSMFSFTLLSIGGKPKEQLSSIFDRFTSLFTGNKIYHSETLNWRRTENKFALRQIVKHPLFGIGLGNDYRAVVYRGGGLPVQYSSWWLHNAYLLILVKMGLIGFLPFLWFCIRFLTRGFSNWKKIKDVTLKSAVTGFMLSGAGIMLIASIQPLFMMRDSITVIATMIGLTEAIIKINKDELSRQNG
jgi:O-antigen ligase